eukprot:TRINITY_DN1476_c0_g1_i1.p1 TRINITY_DN1476_c0_g1~~TRINITY_DN1476_c0_g1_i1.p1  ORF type:complete len:533 (-),score=113.67 TRINITY_DN1476_c0_g1_i1:1255-2853(-)
MAKKPLNGLDGCATCAMLLVLLLLLSCGGDFTLANAEDGLLMSNNTITPELVYYWTNGTLNFTFPDNATESFYFSQNLWRDCIPNGLKTSSNGTMYVSLRRGGLCPVTLAVIETSTSSSSPLLSPFPSWEYNLGGVNDSTPTFQSLNNLMPWRNDGEEALQSVLGFEIDPCDRMWILDQGISSDLPSLPGFAKLLVWDLKTNSLIRKYVFTEDVISLNNSFLDDISVDLVNNFAYITDAGVPTSSDGLQLFSNQTKGGLIVYDYDNNNAWRVLDSHPSVQPLTDYWLIANQEKVSFNAPAKVGADGTGLSMDTLTYYYTVLSGTKVYAIPTASLRNQSLTADQLASEVVVVGDMNSAAGGILFGSDDVLYVTDLSDSAVKSVGVQPIRNGLDVQIISQDSRMEWPDGLGFDNNGNLILISNQLERFLNNQTVTMFGLWRIQVGCSSYMQDWAPLCPRPVFTSTPTANPTKTPTTPSASLSLSGSDLSAERLYFDLAIAFGGLSGVLLITTLGFALLWRRDSQTTLYETPLEA